MTEMIVLGCIVLISVATAIYLASRLRKLHGEHDNLGRVHAELVERLRPVVDIDAERQRVLREIATARAQADTDMLQARARLQSERDEHQRALQSVHQQRTQSTLELQTLQSNIERLRQEFRLLDEESNLQSFGHYKPRYGFSDSERYQVKLDEIRERQKRMLREKTAATCAGEWEINGSKSEGKKQINQTLKLMLRAFNGECDATTAKVKYNNVQVMETRIRKAHEAINALAEIQRCRISESYLELKLQELYLVHEYEEKLQEEKLEQRRIREQMREEEVAQREIEKARLDAEKEEQRYAEALRKAREEAERASGSKQQKLQAQIEELQRKLSEAHANKERALTRAQMTRAGHVYIISNIGSFGEQVYKIGMTRRLEPMDRVKELGDASVPFEFDVHAIIPTEDAPGLENKLHRAFHHRRVNRVNEKKEFFRVELHEIIEFVRDNHSEEVQIVHHAEAEEYRKTVALLHQEQRFNVA
jgi:hypothetical protein